MHTSRKVEIWVGIFVALGLAALLALALRVSNLEGFREPPGFTVTANFQNIGGLKVKAPVTIAGVRVGRVTAIGLDPVSYQAQVSLHIYEQYDQLPLDTTAAILTAGLLGDQYIGLEPGGFDEYLTEGSELEFTQSALVLEQIIGQFLFQKASEAE